MTDLFDNARAAPQGKAAPESSIQGRNGPEGDSGQRLASPAGAAPTASKRIPLHSDTDLYRAVCDLVKFLTRAVLDMRKDAKPLLGKLIVEESIWMGVLVLRANKAPAPEKRPHFEQLLEQVEILQVSLRTAVDTRLLPRSVFNDAGPLTALVAKQATAMRNHFAAAS